MINQIIHKYLSNYSSEKEIQALFDWIEYSYENKKHFMHLKKTWVINALSEGFSNNPISVISIQRKNKTAQYLKYAAVLLMFLGIGIMTFNFNQKMTSVSKEIVLEMADGHSEFIAKNNLTTLGFCSI